MSHVDDLITQMRGLEAQMQSEFDRRRGDFVSVVDGERVRFVEDIASLQRARIGLVRYLTGASLLAWLVAPVIYSGIVLLLLLDLFVLVYQAVCFPVYRIPKVRRADYVVLDRGDLPYLNALERLNCAYCGYANGLAAYFREVAARTEQFFCPVKHARRILDAHSRYPTFFEFGDAESYRLGLERLRDGLAQAHEEQSPRD